MQEVLANPRHATFIHFTWHCDSWNKIWFQTDPPQVFERCDTMETAGHFSTFLHEVVDKTNMTLAFTPCVVRRFMAVVLGCAYRVEFGLFLVCSSDRSRGPPKSGRQEGSS